MTINGAAGSSTHSGSNVTAQLTVSKLVLNTTYYFEYYATNTNGIIAWGGVQSFTTKTA
jgi:hypothetical protein